MSIQIAHRAAFVPLPQPPVDPRRSSKSSAVQRSERGVGRIFASLWLQRRRAWIGAVSAKARLLTSVH
jgi:hypothetical protein